MKFRDYANENEKKKKPQDTLCLVCGKPLGNEVFLGAVHGKCAKKMHRQAVGRK